MSTIMGISAGSHDAAISIINDYDILFASQAERFSKIKNDPKINVELLQEAISKCNKIDKIVFYEIPWLKKLRQLYSGQFYEVLFDNQLNDVKKILKNDLKHISIQTISHHKAHAAQAYLSPFNKSIVLVIDAIGEWNTASIWLYDSSHDAYMRHKALVKLESYSYPYSLGLMYSAFTKLAGFKPNEEEYIYMALSSLGTPKYTKLLDSFIFGNANYKMQRNFHCGMSKEDITYLISLCMNDKNWEINVAASIQQVLENHLLYLLKRVKKYQLQYETENLVYSGGVSLNCVANAKIQEITKNNVWIFPNPGDSGTSLGAACALNEKKVNFNSIYLGYEIKGKYPVENLFNSIMKGNIVGVASGKAEFGPRALGNRSLLADPRIAQIKDEVNKIKSREYFRPFAPVILEEMFNEYFYSDNVNNSPYMQYVYKCKYPNEFPAIVHIDGTSRVQTVNEKQNQGLYKLLKLFYTETHCPMLLNTSLNIKGQPIVNNLEDAKNFSNKYDIEVYN